MKSVSLSPKILYQSNLSHFIPIVIKFICGEEKGLQVDILLSLTNYGNYKMDSLLKYLKKDKYHHQDSAIVL